MRIGQPKSPRQPTPRASARTMPIEAPTANVMATIWNGGIGPADTDSAARAPHRAMAAKPAAIARRRLASAILIGGA